MRVRKLSDTYDMTFGQGQSNFWRDVPDGPAQCVLTRLELRLGEFWLDKTDGTPYNTRVLGKYTASTRDPVIRARILGTQGVTGIAAYGSQLNRTTRKFAVQATIDTQFGQTTVAGPL